MPANMLLNPKITITVFVLHLGGVISDHIPNCYVNIANKKSPSGEVAVCGGVILKKEWAMSSAKCVKHLHGYSKNLVVTAGHTKDKAPEQTSEVEQSPVSPITNDIVLLKLKTPITKSSQVNYAKLPQPDFKFCQKPTSLEFLQEREKRGFGFIVGVIASASNKPKQPIKDPPRTESKKKSDGEENSYKLYAPSYKNKQRFLTFSTKKELCNKYAGWPLMCGETIVGLENKCKLLENGEAESSYINVYKYMRFIAKTATSTNKGNDTDKNVSNAANGLNGRRDNIRHQVLVLLTATLFADILQPLLV